MDGDKLKELLRELGIDAGRNRSNFKESGENIQFCCPFHGETRPSAGIHKDFEYGKCFACGETFNLPKLVAFCKDISIHEAINFLEEKYDVEKKNLDNKTKYLKRIEEDDEGDLEEEKDIYRYELPLKKIAPFRSGIETHSYFFGRGFTEETAKKFMIGWDRVKKRITIPVFWEDNKLCGVIGRVVLDEGDKRYFKLYSTNNDTKYYIYDNFPIGDILYPINFFKPLNLNNMKYDKEGDTAILVEGQLDAIWLHQMGFCEVLSTINSKLTYSKKFNECKQIDLLKKHNVKRVILMKDNDKAGRGGIKHDLKLLKKFGFIVYEVSYPKGKNDPQELTRKEYLKMIKYRKNCMFRKEKLKRIR